MTAEPPTDGVDTERANVARIYDYWLGGAHHFAVDREVGDRIEASNRNARHAARANRAFLGRVVRWCRARGVDQFLDLGSGVPTVGNVHEIAGAGARVAYVDVEPVAVAHAQEILADVPTATVARADLQDPDTVFSAPGVADLLDFSRPVAVLAVAVLHFVPGDLGALLAPYRGRLAPGSVVALTHTSDDVDDEELRGRIVAAVDAYRGSSSEVTLRSRAELTAAFDGMEIVAPGLVDVLEWPDHHPGEVVGMYAAAGVVPG